MMRISPPAVYLHTLLISLVARFFREREIHLGEGRRLAQVLQGPFEGEGGEGEGERGGRREIERAAEVVERRRQVSRREKKFTRQVSGEGETIAR